MLTLMLNKYIKNKAIEKLRSLSLLTTTKPNTGGFAMTDQIIPKPKRVCQVEGCERKHASKGYCDRHYRQVRAHGKVLDREIVHRDPICVIEGCEEKHKAKGYCSRHYCQMWYHGKVLNRTMQDPNEIIIKGDVAEVVLYNQKNQDVGRTIIDAEDVEKINGYKWHLADNGYVNSSLKKGTIGIQHVIMGVMPNRKIVIDHKDRNTLNNRKTNYRLCTHAENVRNSGKSKINTSGYKGVFKSGRKWRAVIKMDKKTIPIGTFEKRIEAAKAYNKAALKHHGEFACINNL